MKIRQILGMKGSGQSSEIGNWIDKLRHWEGQSGFYTTGQATQPFKRMNGIFFTSLSLSLV